MPQPRIALSRPAIAGEVLDNAFQLFRISLIPCLPLSLTSVVLGQSATAYVLVQGQVAAGLWDRDPVWWLLAIGGGLLNLVLWCAVLLRQECLARPSPLSLRSVLHLSGRRFPALLGLSVVALLLTATGFLLLVIPGLYLSVALWFAFPALVLDRESIGSSLATSLRLIRGNWWRTSMIASVGGVAVLVFYVVGSVLGLTIAQLTSGGDVAGVLITMSIVTALLGAVFMPFFSALTYALFADLRMRRDGVDLARRIDAAAV